MPTVEGAGFLLLSLSPKEGSLRGAAGEDGHEWPAHPFTSPTVNATPAMIELVGRPRLAHPGHFVGAVSRRPGVGRTPDCGAQFANCHPRYWADLGGFTMVDMEAAFFDLDKTVIDRASIAAFGRPFMKGGLINRRVVARAAFSQLIFLHFGADEERLARVRQSMLAMTKGWDRDQVRQIVRETLLETIEPIMYAEALELMELHRAAGHRVYLVSASPEEIVLPLTEMLGVDGAICSRGEVDAEGRYTGRMAFYAYGPEKATAIRELRGAHRDRLGLSRAYSDSATDLPMLEAVGRPVAVNADRALAKVARERGWETAWNFTKPIRLRDRVGRTTPVVTTSLAVAGAALILWRRGVRGRTPGPNGRAAA